MSKSAKRTILGHDKGLLNAAGPQSRFIVFLIFVLMAYTLLLRVFQKLAEIVQLPVFLPISLITLLVFIGVIGTVYSHSFVGPLARLRRAVDQMAKGDNSVCLRLRESDDPMLKDLVGSINRLREYNRNTASLIGEAAGHFFADMEALQELIARDADRTEIRKQIEILVEKRNLLEQAVHPVRKA